MKTLTLAVLISVPSSVLASGYEFDGLGARQVSRSGAATASVDDWTAIYWNPAAMTSVRRQAAVEVFGGTAYGEDSDSLSKLPGTGNFSNDGLQAPFLLGALGAVIPLGPRAALGMGTYTPLLNGFTFTDRSATGVSAHAAGSAGILVTNLSAAWRFTDTFSAGAGVNLLYGTIKSRTSLNNYLVAGGAVQSNQEADGMAPEGMVGLLWRAHPRLRLGTTYRSGADVRLRGNANASRRGLAFVGPDADHATKFTYVLRHPPTWDVGLAWDASPAVVLSADLHQTYWRRFSNEFRYDSQGVLTDTANTFRWRDTWKARFGASWRAGAKDELLAGYAYDRWAVDATSVDVTSSLDVPMHTFSAGWSHRWSGTLETTLGAVGGSGTRDGERGERWSKSGFQAMLEMRLLL